MATICELVERRNFAAYVFLCMLVGVFFIISDVAGNCMIIELGKAEPEEVRGYIRTTGRLVRFVTLTFT